MPDRENVISELNEYIESALAICAPDVDYIPVDLLQYTVALLKEQEGEWKNGHCSCCGEDVSSVLDTWTNVQNFLFCPYCGAKMESR